MQPMNFGNKIFLLLGVYIRIVSVINLRVSIYSVFYNILFYYVIIIITDPLTYTVTAFQFFVLQTT
jgi:hypothetical protein